MELIPTAQEYALAQVIRVAPMEQVAAVPRKQLVQKPSSMEASSANLAAQSSLNNQRLLLVVNALALHLYHL
jgi:hypothetical protein